MALSKRFEQIGTRNFGKTMTTTDAMRGSSALVQLHRAIIALNNDSVCLIGKGCNRQATEILRESLAAMKIIQSNDANMSSQYDVTPLLARAAKSVAKPGPPLCCCSSGIGSAQVLTDRENERNLTLARSICETVLHTKPAISMIPIAPVRMEPHDFEGTSTRDPHLTAAILMYNYGISLRCHATSPQLSVEARVKLTEAAVHFFTYSSTLLFRNSTPSMQMQSDHFQQTTKICLATIVLGSLFQTLVDTGMIEEAAKCVSKIEQLRLTLLALDGCWELLRCNGKTAAAA